MKHHFTNEDINKLFVFYDKGLTDKYHIVRFVIDKHKQCKLLTYEDGVCWFSYLDLNHLNNSKNYSFYPLGKLGKLLYE